MSKLTLTVFSVLLCFQAWSQTTGDCHLVLSGTVIDEHDQSVLSFATVYIHDINRGVVADSAGYYQLDGLCPGTYRVRVSHISCEPVEVLVELVTDTQRDLYLEHHIEALREIIIESSHLRQPEISLQGKLSGNILQRYQSATLGDALKEIQGVNALSTGRTLLKPMVQGLYGSRILIINQGVRMQDMEWGDEHAPNIDVNAVSGIRLISGSSALRYGGDAIGGTIVLEPPTVYSDTLFGSSGLQLESNGRGGSFDSELFLANKSGWYGKLQGSVKRFGDFKAPDYHLSNTGMFEKAASFQGGFTNQDLSAEVYYSFYDAEIAILRSSHIGNIDDLILALNSDRPLVVEDFTYAVDPPKQEVAHHLARLRLKKFWRKNQYWQLQYDFQNNRRFEFDLRIGDDRDIPAIDLELTTHTLTGDVVFNQQASLPLEAGILYRFQDNFANPDTGIRRLVPDYQRYEGAAYFKTDYQLNDIFTVDAGIRYDFIRLEAKKFYQKSRWEERGYDQIYGDWVIQDLPTQLLVNAELDYHNLSATWGGQYSWDDQGQFILNYAFTTRAPNPAELFSDGLHQSAARVELGDLNIDREISHKISAVIHRQHQHFHWSIAPYFNYLEGFILLEPAGVEQTIRGAFPVWEYRQTDARLWGVDAQLDVDWGEKFSSQHGASYVHGQDLQEERPLINMPPVEIRNRLSYQAGNQLEFGLESRYNLEQNRYPDNNFQAFLPEADEFREVDISTPPAGYHLVSIQASKQFELGGYRLETGLTVNNLFNTSYRNYLDRLRFYGDQTGTSLQFSLKFNY